MTGPNPQYLFTSESVTEGHPDKVCDQISDGILDMAICQDPASRVACETVVKDDTVMVVGEMTTHAKIDVEQVVRKVVAEIGYTRGDYGFCASTCKVVPGLSLQSKDIAQGVDTGGAGDQGMMFGFACDETDELMPFPIITAHKLCLRLAEARRKGTVNFLRPDGKSQVTAEYRNGTPIRVDTVVISTQHDPDVSNATLHEAVREEVIKAVIPDRLMDDRTKIHINPTGRFVTGGPRGDSGLTGRKIIVDTYGGTAHHGGGAFSGKDPTKVDRSAAYMGRYIAKNLVAAGLARRLEVQIAYAIGVAEPISIMVNTFGTSSFSEGTLMGLIQKHFPLDPKGIIASLDLRRPIFRKTAAYGHFGRNEPEFTWERTDRTEELQKAAGL
jgi:S-adenosylmethionine synthetase